MMVIGGTTSGMPIQKMKFFQFILSAENVKNSATLFLISWGRGLQRRLQAVATLA